jgi:cytochrome P450
MQTAAAPSPIDGFTLADPPAGFVDDPYPWYLQLRAHDPVHSIGDQQWLLTRYDDVSLLYRSDAASSDKQREFTPKFGAGTPLHEHHTTSLVFSDPPLHTRVRRLMMGALNQRAITRMEPGVVALVDGLLDALASRTQADLIEDFAAQIPVEVIGNLLDVPRDERAPLRAWSLAILSALEPVPKHEVLTRGNAAVTEFLAYLRALVAERRRHPGDPEADVLTRLIQGEHDGERLTDTELLHNCIFLLNAGHETTTNLVGNGMHALLTHRDQLERLQREPALLGTTIELLRFEAAATQQPLADVARGVQRTRVAGRCLRHAGRRCRQPRPGAIRIARSPRHRAQAQLACRLWPWHPRLCWRERGTPEARIAIGALVRQFPRIDLAGSPRRDRRVRYRGFVTLPVRLS